MIILLPEQHQEEQPMDRKTLIQLLRSELALKERIKKRKAALKGDEQKLKTIRREIGGL